MRDCLSLCVFLYLPLAMQQAWGNSHLTSFAIPRSLRSVQQTMWGEDVTHPPFSLSPSSPPLYASVICLCAWFSSLDWLTWESQWHRCPQAKTRLDERRHTFLPLSHPRWVPPPCVWSLSTYHWKCWLGFCSGWLFIQLDHAKTTSISFSWSLKTHLRFHLREATNRRHSLAVIHQPWSLKQSRSRSVSKTL